MRQFLLSLLILLCMHGKPVMAQSTELQQLILNVEKLSQLRSILDNMYKGYTILSNGYNNIKNLAEGNFNLHKLFLDKLMEVSPVVKKYKRTVEIIVMQQQLIKEYKSAFNQFRQANLFNPGELDYLQKVYSNLVGQSLKNLDELLMVITSGQLRMNDAERLEAIDRIYAAVSDKLQFLRYFNNKTTLMAAQRKSTLQETERLQRLYDVKK